MGNYVKAAGNLIFTFKTKQNEIKSSKKSDITTFFPSSTNYQIKILKFPSPLKKHRENKKIKLCVRTYIMSYHYVI